MASEDDKPIGYKNPPKGWQPGQSGNPAGRPKGAISLASRIQRMMDDEEFTTDMLGKDGKRVTFKGSPAEAIIKTAVLKAMSGDKQWADWLAKNGYGEHIDLTSGGAPLPTPILGGITMQQNADDDINTDESDDEVSENAGQ